MISTYQFSIIKTINDIDEGVSNIFRRGIYLFSSSESNYRLDTIYSWLNNWIYDHVRNKIDV